MSISMLKGPLENTTGIEKQWKQKILILWDSSEVCGVLLPPAAYKQPWRGCRLGLAAAGEFN